MYSTLRKFVLIIVIAFCALVSATAQPTQVVLKSPEVHPNRTVIFRFSAPLAKEVKLSAQFLTGDQPMNKDEKGIWSITLGPVDPDIYPYKYVVDGVEVPDPNNILSFPNELLKNSLVEIPSEAPAIYSMQDVPHGNLIYTNYKSKTIGSYRPLVIYTPPGYEKNSTTRYPVLYLIHGGSDTYETWTKVGHANLILDNLIAQRKAVPMIIVMPYGNPGGYDKRELFEKDMVNDIIPFVDENYRTLSDQKHRAITGFSVGGGQTLRIGLLNTNIFSYVCAYAPYTFGDKFEKNFADKSLDATTVNKQLRLFKISCGTEDYLYPRVNEVINLFQEKRFNIQTYFIPGAHTWMSCKRFLTETAPLLFK